MPLPSRKNLPSTRAAPSTGAGISYGSALRTGRGTTPVVLLGDNQEQLRLAHRELIERAPSITPEDLEFVRALYDSEISFTAAHIGRLLDALDHLAERGRVVEVEGGLRLNP